MRPAALAIGLVVALAGASGAGASPPPRLPGAIADAGGRLAIVRAAGAGVAAVELSTGDVRWSSPEGEWPLHADADTVAVAAIDPEAAGALRIRFLRLADGRRVAESQRIRLSEGLGIPDPRRVPARATPSFSVTAWVPASAGGPGGPDRRLRLRWEWSFTPAYGFRPPRPEETRRASGVVLVDPASGRVAPASDGEGEPIPQAVLPPAFRPDPLLVYWAFSDHGASWTSRPTPFQIGGGVQGAFAYEPRGERRLTVVRWRAGELLPALELGRGAEYAPVIALGGRFVALSEQKDRRERVLLHDLAGGGTAPIAELPPFGRLCAPPYAIVAERMLCVREGEGEATEEGTSFPRELVAVRVGTGERAWSVAIAPRLLSRPVPGGR
jgi:hypothetical protein